MSDTYTFKDVNNKFTLTVKTEFLTKCDNPDKHNAYDLNSKFYLFKYLHNPVGPAIIRHKDDRKEYWLDGTCLNKENPEAAKKIQHYHEFGNKMEEVLKD